jgi:hypothetical protein
MDSIINEIISSFRDHYKLIASGVGVGIPLVFLFIKKKMSSSNKVTQKNIKAGGDVVGRDKN